MTVSNAPMKNLYKKLSTVGYNPKYIKSILPDWWNDEIANTPSGLQQTAFILGNTFSIYSETLLSDENKPVLKLPQGICFKHRENVESTDLSIACAVARSLAHVVLKTFKNNTPPKFYLDATELRKKLLKGNNWVGLEQLLEYCLNIGIPVIHLNHLPRNAKKMDGLVFLQNGHPVIILTQKKIHGYMLFDLAHELGHITLGHVNANNSVIDDKIDQNSNDKDERAANRFALELLTGDPECRVVPSGRKLPPNQLANAALRYGTDHNIDPFHLILNYGYSTNQWPIATLAVNLIAKNAETDQAKLNVHLQSFLDWDNLSDDDLSLLEIHSIRRIM